MRILRDYVTWGLLGFVVVLLIMVCVVEIFYAARRKSRRGSKE